MKQTIIKKALEDFIQYGFKSFTMDDLASQLGISKKTLYEHFSSKNDLVEAVLDFALEEFACTDISEGGNNVIENIFNRIKDIHMRYKLGSSRPLWELQKYYPKTYERMIIEFRKNDEKEVKNILQRGLKEGLFRENLDVAYITAFFSELMEMKNNPEIFPENKFSLSDIIYKNNEFFIRILVNEKGLKELERILQEIEN